MPSYFLAVDLRYVLYNICAKLAHVGIWTSRKAMYNKLAFCQGCTNPSSFLIAGKWQCNPPALQVHLQPAFSPAPDLCVCRLGGLDTFASQAVGAGNYAVLGSMFWQVRGKIGHVCSRAGLGTWPGVKSSGSLAAEHT